MRMSMGLRLVQRLECGLCLQAMEEDESELIDIALYGAAQYVVCPQCMQVVPEEDRTKRYKQLWTRRVNKMRREAEKTLG